MKKIIFIDVDGTLVSGQNKISDQNIQAICKARQNGHKIYLCTGRAKCSIQVLLQQVDFDGFICSSGGYIENHGVCIYSSYIEDSLVQKAINTLNTNQIDYALETTNASYMTPNLAKTFLGDTSTWEPQNIDAAVQEIYETYNGIDIHEYENVAVHKMCYHCYSLENIQNIKQELQEDFHFIEHGIHDGEIMLSNINKAFAMQKILEDEKAPWQDSVAIGDSMNDYEMLEYASCAIAVGNAKQALKDIATLIVKDVKEDAIEDAFQQLKII